MTSSTWYGVISWTGGWEKGLCRDFLSGKLVGSSSQEPYMAQL